MPILNGVANRFQDQPVSIIGINVEPDLTPQHVAEAHRVLGSVLPSVQDEDGSVQEAYRVRILPTLVVIDRDYLTCPVDEVRDTKVLLTVVGGKVVWERK